MDEELIDVLTPDGQLTGIARSKSEVHRRGEWHRAVHVWILTHDRQLLLQLRSMEKLTYPGLWDISCAGHVSAGESAATTAVREMEEELGLSIAEDELHFIGDVVDQSVFHDGRHFENEYQSTFIVRRDVEPQLLSLQTSEVDDVKLVSVAEFFRRVDRRDASLVPHWKGYELLRATLGV